MKILLYNLNYFFREVKTSIQLNLFTNLFSAISIGLILFILAMVISGWWVSRHVIEIIHQEAEINVFFDDSLDDSRAIQLVERIKNIQGVNKARLVDEQEAYSRMAGILGQEAAVLTVFEKNPFTSFIEVNIDLDQTGSVLKALKELPGIQYVRDNQEILIRLHNIVRFLSILGYLSMVAVSISTLIIISHIIRMSIHSRKDQINTLRLLGACESFIAFPFLLEGILIAFTGSIVAVAFIVPLARFIHTQISNTIPFLPLLPPDSLISSLITLIVVISMSFGLIGSIVGLSSAREL
ncbi:MAG TPA: hypothetical protein GX711_00175 [Clostridia bacterium]|nr:hypothetical protein [Clostridia bacterium]